MLTLGILGLVGGLITGVSPCVLPMLPIILFASSSATPVAKPAVQDEAEVEERELVTAGGGSRTVTESVGTSKPLRSKDKAPRDTRPFKIISGLVVSFSLFTLLGSTLLSVLGLPQDFLRWADLIVLGAVGLGMLVPAVGHLIEKPFYRLPKVTSGATTGPFVLGLGLGTLYVPCAGPILAAITVAGASGTIGLKTVVLTVTFAIGAATPLLFFAMGGAAVRKRIDAYRKRASLFRSLGGAVMILLAIALPFNLTDAIQRALPDHTKTAQQKLADSKAVQGALSPATNDENKDLAKCEPGDAKLGSCGPAPALKDTQKWFNTAGAVPPTLAGFKGKVVLLDFFAYSCINCQRDSPYIVKWYDTYQDDGLVVVGVHSPEFAFEKSAGNLQDAIDKEHIDYPVVQDNNDTNFRNYRNSYWPAKYLIDPSGTVRAIKFGEGDYDQTETLIRQLLTERDPSVKLPPPVTDVSVNPSTADTTPECYLSGYTKNGYAGNMLNPGKGQRLNLLTDQPADTYSLGGVWDIGSESDTSTGQNSQVQLHYHATQVNNVLSGSGTVTVSQPGHPDKVIQVSGDPNLYTLIQNDQSTDETIVLTYSTGVSAYAFSFG